MKKRSHKYIFLCFPLLLLACKDDCQDRTKPECSNYDPCHGKKTINTFFKVRPGDRGFPPPEKWCKLTPCDTFNASSVRFDVPDGSLETSTFEWQIGTEAKPRNGQGFEVDFSDYLRDNGWEQWIPITLTIRTPMNNCLENPKDTFISIKRDLFFTNSHLSLYLKNDTSAKFKGYFTHEPDKEVIMEYIYFSSGEYKGIKAPYALIIGAPFMDTLMAPKNCHRETCRNYRHIKQIVFSPENCDNKELTNYLKSQQLIFDKNGSRFTNIFQFEPPSGGKKYEFRGERM